MMRRFTGHRVAVAALCLIVLGAAAAWSQTKSKSGSTPKAEESGTKARGWLGVYTQVLTDELREGMTYTGPGVLVNGVVDDSPADKVGLKKGDVITALGTVTVSDPDELSDAVRARNAGETVTVKIVRDGKTLTLSPRLEDRSDRDDLEFAPGSEPFTLWGSDDNDHGKASELMFWPGRGRLGVRVENLNSDLNSYFNVPGGEGALVIGVVDDSPAEKAGIKAGDVITSVGGSKIDDTDDLVRTLGKQEDRKVTVQVSRKGATKSFEVELESPGYRYRSFYSPEFQRELRRIEPRVRSYMIPSDDLKEEVEELKREVEQLRRELQKKGS